MAQHSQIPHMVTFLLLSAPFFRGKAPGGELVSCPTLTRMDDSFLGPWESCTSISDITWELVRRRM